MKETKAFYKTSEFWLMVLGQLIVSLQYVHAWTLFTGRWSVLAPIVQSALAYGYIMSRGHAKSGVPAPDPNAENAEFTTPVVVDPGTNVTPAD